MGHFHTEVIGIGRNQKEAQRDAIDTFFHENGHRHDLREVTKATFVEKVPPQKTVEEKRGQQLWIYQAPDPDAPQDQWLEKWEFELHTHA